MQIELAAILWQILEVAVVLGVFGALNLIVQAKARS